MSKETNSNNFDKDIASGTILVDFWAPWCGPCRAQAPTLEQLDESEVAVLKVNVDDNPALAERFGIMSIPTMIVFKDGKEYRRVSGLQNLNQLKQLYK